MSDINNQHSRLGIIDYFKGISIIMIFVCHIVQVFDIHSYAQAVSSFGRMGCQIFFVLSGYAVTMSYEKNSNIKTYYKKRFLSLAPGYWLSILLTLIIAYVTIKISGINLLGTSIEFSDTIINLLLLNGLVPTEANNMVFRGGWFIGSLIIFYILHPVLHKGHKKYGASFLWSCIFGSMIISAIFFYISGKVYSGFGNFLYFSFINQCPSFILGILMYYNTISNKNAYTKSLLLFFVSIVLFYYTSCPFRAVFIPFTFSLFFVYILKLLWNKKLLCSNCLMKVGKLSYPIFLLHIFVIWDIPKLILQHFVPLNTITCVIWGIISFTIVYYISRPYNMLINLFSNRIKYFLE